MSLGREFHILTQSNEGNGQVLVRRHVPREPTVPSTESYKVASRVMSVNDDVILTSTTVLSLVSSHHGLPFSRG
jgi:hypothetical protein